MSNSKTKPCSCVSLIITALGVCAYRTDCQATRLPRSSSKAVDKSCPHETSHREHPDHTTHAIMTMHLVTQHSWLMSFWQRKIFLMFLVPFIHLLWVPVTTFLSQDWKKNLKRHYFGMIDNIKKCNRPVEGDSSFWVSALLWSCLLYTSRCV